MSKKLQVKCFLCDGNGTYKKPNDEETYDKLFDYYADKAYFISMGEAREKALFPSVCPNFPCNPSGFLRNIGLPDEKIPRLCHPPRLECVFK